MSKFPVGTKVKIVGNLSDTDTEFGMLTVGDTGEVVEPPYKDSPFVYVKIRENGRWAFFPDQIEEVI